MIASLRGNEVPVSAMPADGTFPTGTTQFEKRSIALEMPVWNPDVCIQCGKCAMACPHAVIRMKVYEPELLDNAPEGFQSTDAKGRKFAGKKFTIQAAPEDCTGCGLCVETCPAKDKENPGRKAINMTPQPAIRKQQSEYWNFFFNEIPDYDRTDLNLNLVKESQLLRPLFEFSGACAGCGEAPYVRLLSQLFGDRALIANATGCSSIYGGYMPTTPYTKNADGRGPTWNNSLFEDNAEFGYGYRLTLDKQEEYARELVEKFRGDLGDELADSLLSTEQISESDYAEQRERVAQLRIRIAERRQPRRKRPPEPGRRARPPLRVDRRWRWLGLRHRLRWSGPRPGPGPQRQRPGAGHAGVLQHRRSDVQGQPARCRGEVRRCRSPAAQEGPGLDRDDLRQHLRRADLAGHR